MNILLPTSKLILCIQDTNIRISVYFKLYDSDFIILSYPNSRKIYFNFLSHFSFPFLYLSLIVII